MTRVADLAIGRHNRGLGNVFHFVIVFGMCAGVACSMGVGLMQIGSWYRIPERINIRQRVMAHSGSYRYFYFRSVLRIRDREGLEENVLFHKLCIHLPSCCDPDPGADGIHPQHVHRILRCDAF